VRILLAAAGLLLAGSLVYLSMREREVGRPAASPPGFLLVTVDTMRADAAVGTPALAKFLGGATLFARARTPLPLTLPAHLSILSGLEPRRHGVHDNAAPPIPLRRGYPLLQEQFRDAGFATAAFLSCAVLAPETGVAAGFDVVECPPFGPAGSGQHGDLLAGDRVKGALGWIASLPAGRNFFLWVHLFDPHDPYLAYAGDRSRAGTAEGDSEAVRYAGEVRRADAAIESLLEAVPGGTAVVIASDHGESLYEHGEPSHGNLCYSSTADVFLAASGPGLAPGRRDESLRSLADVAPTARLWFALPETPSDGTPLLSSPPGGGASPAPPRVLVTESLLAWRTHGWGQCFAATDGRYTLVESGPRVELFDRSKDPGETSPIPPTGHEAYERLDRALDRYRSRGPGGEESLSETGSPYGSARRPVSTYLPRADNRLLADPATRFGFAAELQAAQQLLWLGRSRDAAERLEALARADATSPLPHQLLARAYGLLAEGANDRALHLRAADAALRSIERGYAVAPVYHLLLGAALASGEKARMEAALEAGVSYSIGLDLSCARLAVDAALGADSEKARETCRRLLERARRGLTAAGLASRLEEIEARLPAR